MSYTETRPFPVGSLTQGDDVIEVKEIASISDFNYNLRPTAFSSPVKNYKGYNYAIYCEADRRPKILIHRVSDDNVRTVYLDPGSDYKASQYLYDINPVDYDGDPHNVFSLGISEDQYGNITLHVVGDMHNHEENGTESSSTSMVARYRNSHIMYWKSDQHAPDVTTFTFYGKAAVGVRPDGFAWSYQQFFNTPDGRLWLTARVKAHEEGHWNGEVGVGLYQFNTATDQWITYGGLPPDMYFPDADPPRTIVSTHKLIFWSNQGQWLKLPITRPPEDNGFYQDLYIGAYPDKDGNIHFGFSINNDRLKYNSTEVVYFKMIAGEIEPQKADGTALQYPVMPTGGGSLHEGDIVYGPDGRCQGHVYINFNWHGDPIAGYNRYEPADQSNPGTTKNTMEMVKHDGVSWGSVVDNYFSSSRTALYSGRDNILMFCQDTVTPSSGDLYRTREHGEAGYEYSPSIGGIFIGIDKLRFTQTGEAVGWKNDGTNLKLMSYKFNFVELDPPPALVSSGGLDRKSLLIL